MRSGYHMFWGVVRNPLFQIVTEVVGRLGGVPSSWNHVRFNEKGYLDQDRCHSPSFTTEMKRYPLHEQVNSIKDNQISPPNVNGSKESNARTRDICFIDCPYTK